MTPLKLTWRVEGRTDTYTVTLLREIWLCDCPSQQHRGTMCRHIRAVSMLQRLALLDCEAVNMLEALEKATHAIAQEKAA